MRFVRLLLHLYPQSFRTEYGAELREIFAQRRRDASGVWSTIAVYLGTIIYILGSAAATHWDILRQDVRYAGRTLRRAPGFAITVVLLAALGVGANTAAFSIADLVLIRPLPFPDPDRLVTLWERPPGYARLELSPATYRDWKRMATSFEMIGAYDSNPINMVGVGEPVRLDATQVSPDLFTMLGARPLAGRGFTDTDARPNEPLTVLLSYGLWQTQFGGDASVIGKRVLLDGTPHVVIGIMPNDFFFPSRDVRLWRPLRLVDADFEDRTNNYLLVIGKLKPGTSLEQSRSEMDVITRQLERQYPKELKQSRASIYPLHDEIPNRARLLLIALVGAALCILLIACANLASLYVARAVARGKELAVRAALGAGRERLVRQLATESLLLAAIGGTCGVLVAIAAVPLLGQLVPATLPIAGEPSVDLRVLLFAGVLTAFTGLAFGVLPAWRAGGRPDLGALRDGTRAGGGRKERVRGALVIAEVTGTVVLLIASGLLMRAIWRLQATDPGFRADGLLTLATALPLPKYDSAARREEFYRRVIPRVQAIPGVTGVAYISYLPMVMRGGIWGVGITGEEVMRTAGRTASLRFVTPGYFSTMGIPVRRGRDVGETDTRQSPSVAVVSESFVRHFFPGLDAMGRRFQFGLAERTIVGIVGDVRVRGLEIESEPQVYLPHLQSPDAGLIGYTPKSLVVRSSLPPASLLPVLRAIVHDADPDQPISDVQTMREVVSAETASRALQLRLLGVLAALACLLAGVGIHGLLAFTVSHRAQEIGVRMALGAQTRDIVGLIVRQGLSLVGAGLVLGLGLAYATGRTMDALLAGVTPGDLPTFASAVGLCLVMALVGCLVPAWRAARVDPISVIRSD